jgi:MFS family permease
MATKEHQRGHRNWRAQHGGWRLIATLAVTETTSYGVLAYAFGVFLLPMEQELSWSRTALTGAYATATVVSGAAAIPVGRWLDHHGARSLMTAGSAAATVLVLAWAHVSDLAAFYFIWVGIGFAMAAVLYEPAFAVIVTWFPDEDARTRALLALTTIVGFASVIYVPLTGWLVQGYGWRDALIVLTVLLILLTVLPNATLPSQRSEHDEPPADTAARTSVSAAAVGTGGASLRSALHDQALWWLAAAFVAATLATTTVTVHLVTFLREQHYSAGFAATWTGLLGAGSVAGRILVTSLGRRWSLAIATATIFTGQALGVTILLAIPGPIGVIAFVSLFGLGVGLISLSRAALVADMYGLSAYASINGVLVFPVTTARAVAPVAAAALRTGTGSYQLVLIIVAVCALTAAAAMARAQQLHRQLAAW